ncbi:MAG TPA: NrfD/PsrC family molybdoenzyme membrane anchor subunit [Terriglobales bacterium]|nr:NrfD/PsrC family molybdoenzyme membrane anchor subunit [Terriglobales bacterium]
MSTWPSESQKQRQPTATSEARLHELRSQAERKGRVEHVGVHPEGAPFPRASVETGYYGIPLLKQPPWTWEIPLYFAVGGAAGAAAVIAALADWIADDDKLAQDARWIAVGGAALSSVLLISDLGRPKRFLGMLRVFKLQSPMSVGAWTLTAFGSAAGAATFAKLLRSRYDWLPIRIVGEISQGMAALLGLPLHNYTGVLIGASAVPVWNKNVKTLPVHFGMSGLQAGVSVLELMGNENAALNWLGILASAFESWEGFNIESDSNRVLTPLKRGRSGFLTRAGGVLSGPTPLLLRLAAVFSKNSDSLRKLAACCGIAGSVLTRYAWMSAGRASTKDWRLPLEVEDKRPQEKPLPARMVEAVREPRRA